MTPADRYMEFVRGLVDRIRIDEADRIREAARRCADAILKDRLVHVFGTGHSRVPVEEFFPRYGSFPGFHPIVELSLTFHNPVVGANGQRQALFIENVPGLAERILRNFDVSPDDVLIVFSSSGTTTTTVEMASLAREVGMFTVGVTSWSESERAGSEDVPLSGVCDVVIDNGAPPADAAVRIDGLEFPVGPVSTIGSCLVANAIKAEVAEILTRSGQPPLVLTSTRHLGEERAWQSQERAYDEYRRRIGVLYR